MKLARVQNFMGIFLIAKGNMRVVLYFWTKIHGNLLKFIARASVVIPLAPILRVNSWFGLRNQFYLRSRLSKLVLVCRDLTWLRCSLWFRSFKRMENFVVYHVLDILEHAEGFYLTKNNSWLLKTYLNLDKRLCTRFDTFDGRLSWRIVSCSLDLLLLLLKKRHVDWNIARAILFCETHEKVERFLKIGFRKFATNLKSSQLILHQKVSSQLKMPLQIPSSEFLTHYFSIDPFFGLLGDCHSLFLGQIEKLEFT